jgi:hypothetical protein
MDDAQQIIGGSSIVGAAIALVVRANQKYARRWKSSLQILYTDYTLEDYATITILSFLYAVGVGALSGASTGAILYALRADGNEEFYFLLSGLFFLGVPVLRISTEGYTVIYKTAQDASRYFRISTRKYAKEDPALKDESETARGYSTKRTPNYSNGDPIGDYLECLRILQEEEVDISQANEKKSFIGANTIIIRDGEGAKIAEFTKNSSGNWT